MKYFVTNNPPIFNPYTNITICTVEDCLIALSQMPIIGLDTETTGFDPYTKELLLVQFGNFDDQYALDNTVDLQRFKGILEDPNRLFILQNAKFDLRFFYHKRIVVSNVFDTMLAEKMLWLGYPAGMHSASLKTIAERYLGVELDKEIRGMIHREKYSERVVEYGCNDVKYLEKIMELQLIEIRKKGLEVALQIENEFVKVLAYIEYSGIKLDPEKWKEKMLQDKINMDTAKKTLDDWIIDKSNTDNFFRKYITQNMQGDLFEGFNSDPICTINWDSSQQVIPIFKHLGFNTLIKDKKTGQMKHSVEAKVIQTQMKVSNIAGPYLEFKGCSKIVGTYGQSFLNQINPVSRRIHTQFTQLMDTGRLSCGGKNKDTNEEYPNLQNLPADDATRHSFVAQSGYKLIDCDYTAQEDFVFTELSQEPKLIDFYNDTTRKRDGHSFVAKICFPEALDNVTEEEVKNVRPDLRALAKKAKFSIHYGGNGSTIATNLSLPQEQGYAIEKAYLSGFENINNYFKHVKTDMWNKGYILISALTGHKMFIWDWEDLKLEQSQFTQDFWEDYRKQKQQWIEEGEDPYDKPAVMKRVSKFFKTKSGYERNSLNAPVQGTSAIITKVAGIRYFNHLVRDGLLFKVWIPNCVHDEYLVEAPDLLIGQECLELQSAMEEAGKIFVKSVSLRAVPEVAPYWKH